MTAEKQIWRKVCKLIKYSLHTTVEQGGNRLVHWKVNRNYNTDFFFPLWIFLGSTDHSAQNIKWRKKHWVIFFLLQTQTCPLTLNGTLCVSLLVLEWVWRHTDTRLGPVLQKEGHCTVSLPKVNSLGIPNSEAGNPAPNQSPQIRTVCLAPDFVLLSIDLPCRQHCYCWEETLLSKHSHLGQLVSTG